MKTLTLVRHAKSSWKDRGLPDRARPLNKRGRCDAPMMGRRLAPPGADVDRIISSPAARATATAEALAEELDYPWDEIVIEERLYEADAEEILTVVEEQDDWIDHVMLVGHNPGLTRAANLLSRSMIENVPTCGVVELRYDVDGWAEIVGVKPVQVLFDYPKKRRR